MSKESNSENFTKRQLVVRFEAEAVPHLPIIKRLAYKLMRNSAEAEDLVQETFFLAFQAFARFESGTNCRAWLCKIMFRKRFHLLRANARFLPLNETSEQVAADWQLFLPSEFISPKLHTALLNLPLNYRQVVYLCFVEELTYNEAAERLTVPVGTVMSRLHRGRKMLRSEFKKTVVKSQSAHYQRALEN